MRYVYGFLASIILWAASALAQSSLLVSHMEAQFQWDLQPFTAENAPESHVLTCGGASVTVPMPATSIPVKDVVPGPGAHTCVLYAQNGAGRQADPDVPFPLFTSGYTPSPPIQLSVLDSTLESPMALTKAYLGAATADTSSNTIAVTVDSTGYTHIVAFVKHEQAATTITAADDKGSGAYNALTKVDHSNNDLSSRLLWVKIGTPGAAHTITVTLGANKTYRRIAIWGVNAATGELALDVESTAQGTGTAIDAGSLATTAPTVSFMGVGEFSSVTYTPGSGWTEDLDNFIHAQSRADTSGTLDPVATASSSMSWTANAASFKEVGGGGTANSYYYLANQ